MREKCNVTLIGTILGEPQRGRTKGNPIKNTEPIDTLNLELAVTRTFRGQPTTDRYPVGIYGKQAITGAELLKRGAQVQVQGEVRLIPCVRDGVHFDRISIAARTFDLI